MNWRIAFFFPVQFFLYPALADQPAFADQAELVAALNESWAAYKAATDSGDPSAIIKTAEAAVVAGRRALEKSDERLPLLLTNYGTGLLAGAQPQSAQEVLREALKLSEDIHGKDAKELVSVLQPLGDSVADLNSPSQQLWFYRHALKIIEQHSGRVSVEYAAASMRAATKTYELSRSTAGIKYLRDAREVFGILNGEESSEAGLADYLLATFERANRDQEKAIDYALEALPKLQGDSPELLVLQMYTRALLVQVYEERNMTEEATPHCIAIGRISKLRPDQDIQPLFRMAPRYPAHLLRAGIEGHVDFEFTIDENGFVRDPHVIKAVQTKQFKSRNVWGRDESDQSFEAAALEVVERFRYAPMFVDGVATPIEKVTVRINFKIED